MKWLWLAVSRVLIHPSLLPVALATFISVAGPGGVAEIGRNVPGVPTVAVVPQSPAESEVNEPPFLLVLNLPTDNTADAPPVIVDSAPEAPEAADDTSSPVFEDGTTSDDGTPPDLPSGGIEAPVDPGTPDEPTDAGDSTGDDSDNPGPPEDTDATTDDSDSSQDTTGVGDETGGDDPAGDADGGDNTGSDTGDGDNTGDGDTGDGDTDECDLPPGEGHEDANANGQSNNGHDRDGDGVDDHCQNGGDGGSGDPVDGSTDPVEEPIEDPVSGPVEDTPDCNGPATEGNPDHPGNGHDGDGVGEDDHCHGPENGGEHGQSDTAPANGDANAGNNGNHGDTPHGNNGNGRKDEPV